MRIVMTGATGFLGRNIAAALKNDGHELVLAVRNASRLPQELSDCKTIACDFSSADQPDWPNILKDADIVINAVGILREQGAQTYDALHANGPITLFNACKAAGVKRIIQISAIGAEQDAVTQYHTSKLQADEALRQSGADHTILRPSIIYGEGGASWTFFQAMSILPVVMVPGGGEAPVQPLHISDVVQAVRTSLKLPAGTSHTVDLVGSQTLTFKDYLAIVRQYLGYGKLRTISMRYPVARMFAVLGSLTGSAPMSPDAITMLETSKAYDVANVNEKLEFTPIAFEEHLKANPATPAQKSHAALYFAAPLLRLSLALMWIWAAIVSAFIYPQEKSYQLLAQTGLEGVPATVALYGASALDLLIGIGLLITWRVRLLCWLQLAVVITYTAILTISIPELWAHPFGPLVKNIPVLAAVFLVMMLHGDEHV